MFSCLSNDKIKVQVNSAGAELSSLMKEGDPFEYMWQGLPEFWTGRSPVLFPIIGAVKNGEYRHGGMTYKMANHGLARRSEFELVSSGDEELVYQLKYSEESLHLYPFKFLLELKYRLEGSKVVIAYRVENLGDGVMPFQLGTHPAFNCPMNSGKTLEDYKILFNKEESCERIFIKEDNLLESGVNGAAIDGDSIGLSAELFYNGALIYKDVKSDVVSLVTKNYVAGTSVERKVMVSSKNLPHLGIWQPKDAPFVCIEPWRGLADFDDFDGEIGDKEAVVKLGAGEVFECEIGIEV